jgi:hypothetical protein
MRACSLIVGGNVRMFYVFDGYDLTEKPHPPHLGYHVQNSYVRTVSQELVALPGNSHVVQFQRHGMVSIYTHGI